MSVILVHASTSGDVGSLRKTFPLFLKPKWLPKNSEPARNCLVESKVQIYSLLIDFAHHSVFW